MEEFWKMVLAVATVIYGPGLIFGLIVVIVALVGLLISYIKGE